VMWTVHLAQEKLPVMGPCEYTDKPSRSIKQEEFWLQEQVQC
jgi:hypothetical protein